METLRYHPLIQVTAEDIQMARESLGLNDVRRIRESIDAIEDWCRKQPHLAEAYKYLDRDIFERLFLLSKASVEGTKEKLDKLLTSRGKLPDIVLNRKIDEFDDFAVKYVPLPKLHPVDQSRIMVTQFIKDKVDDFNLLTYFRYCFFIGEYRLHYDYSFSERYVIDLNNVQVSMLSKINPVVVKKAEFLCTEGFGTKIKGIHILNAPSYVDRFVFLLKQALKEKVAKRLHVHSSYEELQQHIPKECLPKEYDGDQPSCSKLFDQWKEILKTEDTRKFIQDSEHFVSNESLRMNSKLDADFMGVPGNFRKLNVD